jgi:hypothetical protein
MSATFAERGICSLLDIQALPVDALHAICQTKVEKEDFDTPKDTLYLDLQSKISDLKSPKTNFHEEAKSLQDRLDGFRDKKSRGRMHCLPSTAWKSWLRSVCRSFFIFFSWSPPLVSIFEIYWRVLRRIETPSYHDSDQVSCNCS